MTKLRHWWRHFKKERNVFQSPKFKYRITRGYDCRYDKIFYDLEYYTKHIHSSGEVWKVWDHLARDYSLKNVYAFMRKCMNEDADSTFVIPYYYKGTRK